jgi:ADP-heptose:LPS heptosyltransferase
MDGTLRFILSPFSNSDVRDWPAGHFSALIGLLLQRASGRAAISVIGTPSQALRADGIVRPFDSRTVRNDCGLLAWDSVVEDLAKANCVIGNNSGIAHLSAALGTPTLCIFGGSHQRAEWHPMGKRVRVLSRAIWCSPCHLDRASNCLYDKACLTDITPEAAAEAAFGLLTAN